MRLSAAVRLLLLVFLAFGAGCTGVAGPSGGLPHSSLVAERRQSATALEAQGQLRESLNEWKVALTIDPKDSASLEGKARLDDRIARALADTLARGRDSLKRGIHLEARRQFLIALALDPTNREAFEALQNEAKEVRFINHVVRTGETLSSIAALYYGDRSRSDILWETNQLSVNTKLVPGTTLKIPEVPGLPFGRPDPPRPTTPRKDAAAEPTRSDVPVQEESYAHPMLAEAKEALERRDYSLALTTVDRFLSVNPRNLEATEIKRNSLFLQGKALLDQKRLDDSLAAFNQILKINPKDQESLSLIATVKSRLVQDHYNQGIRYFREEKLDAAIGEWRAVLQYDSGHEGARKNIEQAERLLKGLQQRQQKNSAG